MTNPADSGTNALPGVIERHRAWRITLALALSWLLVHAAVNSVSVANDLARRGVATRAAEPWIWEFSSAAGLILWVLPVLWFDRWLRARWRNPWPRALALAAGSVVFSVGHVAVMVGGRQLAYRIAGWTYDFGPWQGGLLYEYRKDVLTYASILAVAAVLRLVVDRTAPPAPAAGAIPASASQPVAGSPLPSPTPASTPPAAPPEPAMPFARPLPAPPVRSSAPESEPDTRAPELAQGPAVASPGRRPVELASAPRASPPTFMVRTATQGDLLVRADDIDWIEAQGNYVALHLGNEVRLLRQTLSEMEARLRPHGFIRTHRRALVNRSRMLAITPPERGEPGVRLSGGQVAPLSESRRAEVLRLVLG